MRTSRRPRLFAAAVTIVLVVAACGDDEGGPAPDTADEPAEEASAAAEPAEPEADTVGEVAADDAPDESGDLDTAAWCELATASVVALRYDDPDLLAEDVGRLEAMTELTAGEMRAVHEAALALRRDVLAVVEGLVDPGMDFDERQAAVDGHPSVLELTQQPETQRNEASLMGHHLEHCF